MNSTYLFYFVVITYILIGCKNNATEDYLISFTDSISNTQGYKNSKGKIVIAAGKYINIYTDTFKNFAIVTDSIKGPIGIDRKENFLYKIFMYDNGPDEVSEDLFRIIKDDKIGYANIFSGNIVIPAKYECAWPFENGHAKVSYKCNNEKFDGEHTVWQSSKWFFINKKGMEVNKEN